MTGTALTEAEEFEAIYKLADCLVDTLDDWDCTDEEFDTLVEKEMAEYDPYWKPCIILDVNN